MSDTLYAYTQAKGLESLNVLKDHIQQDDSAQEQLFEWFVETLKPANRPVPCLCGFFTWNNRNSKVEQRDEMQLKCLSTIFSTLSENYRDKINLWLEKNKHYAGIQDIKEEIKGIEEKEAAMMHASETLRSLII